MATIPETRVVMVFRHHAQAQRAVDALLDAGFTRDEITLSEPDAEILLQLDAEPPQALPPDAGLPALAVAGAALGATLGGLGGWLGRPLGRGLGRNLTLGVVLGAAVGAAVARLAVRFYGATPEPTAPELALEPVQYDQGSLDRGRAMVTVESLSRLDECDQILRSFGGRRPAHTRAPERGPLEPPVRPDEATAVFPALG